MDNYQSRYDFIFLKPVVSRTGCSIEPAFRVMVSDKLMLRGNDFYAIWDDDAGMWTTDIFEAFRLIDEETARAREYYCNHPEWKNFAETMYCKTIKLAADGVIDKWNKFCQKQCPMHWEQMDNKLVFHSDPVKKEDYSTHRLPYDLSDSPHKAFDKLMDVLYSPEELHKILWCVGAVLSNNGSKVQKFMVLYGDSGTGKSTVLRIIEKIFDGYWVGFEAEELGARGSAFALAQFSSNPLVAIQHDGDLSRIESNTKLNSLISHETVEINEKYKAAYNTQLNTFLFMGTNKPVKITDSRSGIKRRLIDVSPTGDKVPPSEYQKLMGDILKFEIGSIAKTAMKVFLEDPNYYDDYIPYEMTSVNHLFDFLTDHMFDLMSREFTTLGVLWEWYKEYVDSSRMQYSMNRLQLKDALKPFFKDYKERWHHKENGEDVHYRSVYFDFIPSKVVAMDEGKKDVPHDPPEMKFKLVPNIPSRLDDIGADYPAQYANDNGTPEQAWSYVKTKLRNLDTKEEHYVRVPENLIVIDFDIKDDDGEKSFTDNLKAAEEWPLTYAEVSKSGKGIHLHYWYEGDPHELAPIYEDQVEIKVYKGKTALRRKLTLCNDVDISTLAVGTLPLKKGGSKTIADYSLKDEKHLRNKIAQHLRKEICPGTKPSIDMIVKCLDEAYSSGMKYDISDMKQSIISFASKSSHHAQYCLGQVSKMHFKSELGYEEGEYLNDKLVIFDCEVYPNLLLINWKFVGAPKNSIVRMINPSPEEVLKLTEYKLIGFNNRRYDNHILYARILGYDNKQIFELSQRIIVEGKTSGSLFAQAYNLSYTDIYDFSAKKQSLKKWEIELKLHHQEMSIPWDEPVPEEKWPAVAAYCDNDVIATEAVWNHLQADFRARQILVEICKSKGIECSLNTSTNSLTQKIVFGNEKHPQLEYPDISEEFPGYEYVRDELGRAHNMYHGVDLGFGGWVTATPGMYTNVALLDVKSMHPTSINVMNLFGEYTQNFKDIYDARQLIKNKKFDEAKKLLNGVLAPYLDDPDMAKELGQALKIAINAVYGQTSAAYDNPFRDKRNVNNIVALRGALFMKSLYDEVEKLGYSIIHVKTDSIKIPNADEYIIKFCMDYALKYGYEFEHEATYDKMCLVNNAVYICYHDGRWDATGKEFQVPYVYKKLFSKEPIEFDDICQTFEVKKGSLYLDMNVEDEDVHDLQFVGRIGNFVPVSEEFGGILYRVNDDKYYAAAGSKGYFWQEAEKIRDHPNIEDMVDRSYWESLVTDAINHISEFTDFNTFIEL